MHGRQAGGAAGGKNSTVKPVSWKSISGMERACEPWNCGRYNDGLKDISYRPR